MIRGLTRSEIAMWGIVLLCFGASAGLYPRMPELMAAHWNIHGNADGYMPKSLGLFLLPTILAVFTLVFIAIPRIDPLKSNIQQFRSYYDGFVIVFLLFMLSIHVQVILWNLGVKISFNRTVPIGLGILFFSIGVLCEHVKRNWFIGIRTPWTLSNDRVWEKTHRVGGKLFKVAGAIAVLGAFFQAYMIPFILAPAILTAIFTVVYSFYAYRRETT